MAISDVLNIFSRVRLTLVDLINSSHKHRAKFNDSPKVAITGSTINPKNKVVTIRGEARGTSLYPMTIAFYNVSMSTTRDAEHQVLAKDRDSNEYYLERISMSKHKCQVRCSCRDFYFTWQWWDRSNKALFGPNFPKYVRKTTTWPERNPGHYPGLCKHLMGFVEQLKNSGLLRQ